MPDDSLQMRCKAVVSGDIVELYFYKVPVKCGFKRDYDIEKDIDKGNEKREGNLMRARKTIRQVIWSNHTKYTKFITLTYAETELDISKVRNDIKNFVRRMNRIGYDMKYLYVLENQRERGLKEDNEGSLHVHMVLFIDKYIPKDDIDKCWKKGYTGINAIDNVTNLGAYVCKYITKENLQQFGKRTFSCSLGLDRPEEERFYTLGFSDTVLDFQPEEVLRALDITYHRKLNHDYLDPITGEGKNQEVMYYQGKWKQGNVIKERDPLYVIERQINDFYISQNDPIRE